ncbi:MAG: right-handed parallel beta-helix repeat-containing protein [Myxococcales bacterium]
MRRSLLLAATLSAACSVGGTGAGSGGTSAGLSGSSGGRASSGAVASAGGTGGGSTGGGRTSNTGVAGSATAGGSSSTGSSGGGGSAGDAGCAPLGVTSATADLYVATDGNDSWAGTQASPGNGNGPLATLAAAQAKVASLVAASSGRTAPIVVLVRGGTYRLASALQFDSASSGTASLGVVYAAYPGETPVFSGGVDLTGWTSGGGSLWTANLPGVQPFEQLFVNGTRRYRPRSSGSQYLHNAGPVLLSSAQTNCPKIDAGVYECRDRFRFNPGDLDPSWRNLNEVEIDDFEDWTMARLRLSSIDADAGIAYLTGPTYGPPYHGFLTGHRYLAENVEEALSQPGQWYLDSSGSTPRLSYLAAAGENPSQEAFVAPQAPQLLVASGLSHVTFAGLTFSYSNWTVPAAGHPSGQGETDVPAAVSFQDCSDIALLGVTISHVGGWALEFVGTASFTPSAAEPYDFQVVGSTLTDLGAGGLRIGRTPASGVGAAQVAQYAYVHDTIVSGGGRFLPAGVGIWIADSHDDLLDHDEVGDFYNVGVSLGFTFNYAGGLAYDDTVRYTLIHDLGQGVTSDMGGVYSLVSNNPNGNVFIEHNVIHDVTSNQGTGGYGGWGLYFDQGTTGVTAENNLVYRTSTAGFHQNWGENNLLKNNVFAYGVEGEIDLGRIDPAGSFAFTLENDLFYWDSDAGVQLGNAWDCPSVSGKTSCPAAFLLQSNLYDSAAGLTTLFRTSSPAGRYDLAQWQALGEDASSIVGSAGFAAPDAGDFTLLPGSAASSVGFVPFDPTRAGVDACGPPEPPPVPAAFPLQLLSSF